MPGASGWYPGRCKDCSSEELDGSRCAECKVAHNAREAARRAERQAAGRCTVCGKRAIKVAGVLLTTCKTHREYFRARDEASRRAS
jgi:hypothetical protein